MRTTLFHRHQGKHEKYFRSDGSENRAICVPGVGSTKPFSVLVVDRMPDLHFLAFGQCLPRYRFVERKDGELFDETGGLERVDNIPDAALRRFQAKYGDGTITKDCDFRLRLRRASFSGVSRAFCERSGQGLAANTAGGGFRRFSRKPEKGWPNCISATKLARNTRLRSCSRGPESGDRSTTGSGSERCGSWTGEKAILVVNDHIRLGGIPPEAHGYQVNGRTPLEWLMDRYRITQDNESGIVNDPNRWFENPEDLIRAIRRIVRMSVETEGIVEGLPDPFETVRQVKDE